MAGEQYVLEVEVANVGLVNFQNNQIVQIDTANTPAGSLDVAGKIPSNGAGQAVLGVCKDAAHVDAVSGLVTSAGMNVRIMGISRVIASGAIAAGAYVGTAATNAAQGAQGQALPTIAGAPAGQAASQAAAGALPTKPVLGIALTPASAAGDQPLVLLTPGVCI